MALAMVDERETFLAAWGLRAPSSTPVAPTAASARAEEAVRAFNARLERCYAEGSTLPLEGPSVSSEVLRAVRSEIAHPVAGPASRALRLVRLAFVQIEPSGGGGWTLTTEEVWGGAAAPGRAASRLRFRYRLAPSGEGLRIEEMAPVLPEPVDAAAR